MKRNFCYLGGSLLSASYLTHIDNVCVIGSFLARKDVGMFKNTCIGSFVQSQILINDERIFGELSLNKCQLYKFTQKSLHEQQIELLLPVKSVLS